MHRALYRKWRPVTFADVVGQEAITGALCNQITSGKTAHAYLFTGTRGTGKTTCAKIFAKAINCENPQGANPCGECACCRGIDDGSILDVTEIDAASNNSVEDVRTLREETAYRPSRCRYRVYIIDEVHMLSTSAFNALLKIMEEPPGHVVFILATTEIHKVPATIISRCQRFDFGRIPSQLIAGRLLHVAAEEGIELTEEAAELIARLADGALRDALSLLDTCSGTAQKVDEPLVRQVAGVADKRYLFALSEAVHSGNISNVVEQVAALRAQSIDVKRLTEELVYHYRTLLLAALQPGGALLQELPTAEQQQYIQEAKTVGEAESLRAVRRLTAAVDRMPRTPDPRIELEIALFDLCLPPEETQAAPPPKREQAQPATPAPRQAPVQQAAPVPSPAAPVAPVTATPVEEKAPPPPPVSPQEKEAPPKAPAAVEGNSPPVPQPTADESADLPEFTCWPQVIENMKSADRMLYSFMQQSKAYLDGKRVLIDGGDMFLTYMRDYPEATEKVKNAIQEVSGTRYAVGPYKKTSARKVNIAQQSFEELAAKGVEIIEE